MREKEMNILNRIQWHEGMLLTPQHFQVESTRIDSLIAWHSLASSDKSWGIRKCKFDNSLLASGILRVLQIDVLMPDGTAIVENYEQDQKRSLQIELDEHELILKEKGKLDVYLALAIADGIKGLDGTSRFDSVITDPIEDVISEADAVDIPRLKPALKLIAGDTPTGGFKFFRLCTVINRNDVIALGDELPAMVDVYACPKLIDDVRKFAENLRGKATFIGRQLLSRQDSKGDDDKFLLLQRLSCLVSDLPNIEAILSLPNISPIGLYLCLSSALGPLSQLKIGGLPPTVARYDHENLHLTFNKLLADLNSLIDQVSQDYREVPFLFENETFSLRLRSEWISSTLIIGVKGLSTSDADQWVRSVIIGSEKSMEEYREKRILGAKRRSVQTVENLNLRAPPGTHLFEILTPKDMQESDYRLFIAPSGRLEKTPVPDDILLYIKGVSG
ncbi:MAG: hypothetical protein CBC42_04155 [Betaproteobacteria bacterium TMED82]|nr:MAG: hypothetical protein CBC42_04155 [Betaproteobacteria bacterium TMED82]